MCVMHGCVYADVCTRVCVCMSVCACVHDVYLCVCGCVSPAGWVSGMTCHRWQVTSSGVLTMG
jgi:hypothetical protein